jgi:glucokinase
MSPAGPRPAPHDSPRLLADVGGTWARFALETAPGRLEHPRALACAEHAEFDAAVRAYLDTLPPPLAQQVAHAAVAIANPVEGDEVRMTNYRWAFSIERTRQRLGLLTLVVVNDFTALAMALPRLGPAQRRAVGGGQPRARSVMGVLGAGTGLGMSGLIPAADGWVALGTEGGHASFAPRDEREIDILRFAQRQLDHVSFERLLSGPGLELIHAALRERAGLEAAPLPAPEITRRALAGECAACTETVDTFCAVLGTAAANLAVSLGALGGVWIGGGIVPRLGERFAASPFRARFEDKGRFSGYLRGIPTWVITDEQATFHGAAAILGEQLAAQAAQGAGALLAQIRRLAPGLSPAERRVAEQVLAHPRAALSDPIAEIARAAQVSQPTVIRFCRSLGCEGLSDFKLRLAGSLSGTVPLTHTQVRGDDSSVDLGAKVLSNTAGAVLALRQQLGREAMDRAIALLSGAARVEFYAVGHYGVVADDAQFKFLRLGLPAASVTDPRRQPLAAAVLRPGDVAVVASASGSIAELLHVAERARERGAAVIAIAPSGSALVRKADVALLVDHVEDVDAQLPMVGRILHLLVVDMLAVGVAMRRGAGAARLPQDEAAALEETPGALAHLTPHSR